MKSVTKPSLSSSCCFLTESSLVEELLKMVTFRGALVKCEAVTLEFGFDSGRTDLLGITLESDLHAFEAKLSKWKSALHQAFKNSSFAHYVYVVMPERTSKAAIRAKLEFEKRGVGLIILGGKSPKIEIKPRRFDPLLPWITRTAQKILKNQK